MANEVPSGSSNASATIGAIAALGMLAAPTAVSVANAQRGRAPRTAESAEVRCIGASADTGAAKETRPGTRKPARTPGLHAHPGDVEPAASRLAEGEMRAHYIDVGQGVATLYEFSCGVVLVDTGGEVNGVFDSDRALENYLDQFFLARPELSRTIDLLVLSHPHIDHAHGAPLVTSKYTVKNVVTDGLLKDPHGQSYSGSEQQQALEEWAKAHAKLETISTKKVPKGGKTDGVIDPIACAGQDPQIRVLWGASEEQPEGWSDAAFKDANNHSVALRVDFGKASFLTTGDLEVDAVRSVVALHGTSHALDADVWEVSHHGSANGTNQAILDAITPQIATLGTGDPARTTGGAFTAFAFGHPREDAVDLILGSLTRKRPDIHVLAATGQKEFESIDVNEALCATGWDGTVVITGRGDGTYSVQTER